jgi:hypothetical protein
MLYAMEVNSMLREHLQHRNQPKSPAVRKRGKVPRNLSDNMDIVLT